MISILKGIRNLTDSPAVNLKKYKGGKFLKRPNARNVSFELLYGGQFTLSTQLIKPNYLIKYRALIVLNPPINNNSGVVQSPIKLILGRVNVNFDSSKQKDFCP